MIEEKSNSLLSRQSRPVVCNFEPKLSYHIWKCLVLSCRILLWMQCHVQCCDVTLYHVISRIPGQSSRTFWMCSFPNGACKLGFTMLNPYAEDANTKPFVITTTFCICSFAETISNCVINNFKIISAWLQTQIWALCHPHYSGMVSQEINGIVLNKKKLKIWFKQVFCKKVEAEFYRPSISG